MISAGKAVRKLLNDDAGVAAVRGTRMYPGTAVEDSSTYPLCLYSEPDMDVEHHLNGIAGVEISRLQIKYYGKVYGTLKNLADISKVVLNTFQSGSVIIAPDTLIIQSCKVVSEMELPTEDLESKGSNVRIHSIIQIVEVAYET